MSDGMDEPAQQDRSAATPGVRIVASLGLLVALGTFLFVALVAPDDGVDPPTLRSGIGIAAVVAAAPIAVLLHSVEPSRVVALGGAMTVAGVGTMVGGNLFGLIMAVVGLPILLVGASRQPPISTAPAARLVGYAILLGIAMWLSLNASLLSLVGAVLLAALVATSPRWDEPRARRKAAS